MTSFLIIILLATISYLLFKIRDDIPQILARLSDIHFELFEIKKQLSEQNIQNTKKTDQLSNNDT